MKSFTKTENQKERNQDKEMNIINTSMNNIKTDDTKSIERNLSDVNISIITETNVSPVTPKKTSPSNEAIFLNTSYTNKEKKTKRQEKCLKKIILFLVIFAMCSLLYVLERKLTLRSR